MPNTSAAYKVWTNCIIFKFCILTTSFFVTVTGSAASCKTTLKGVDYRGSISKTKGGIPCQRWSSQIPHKHKEDPYSKQDANYCRNPDNEPFGPWCYTTDPYIRWDYCDVPLCKGVVVSNLYTGRMLSYIWNSSR